MNFANNPKIKELIKNIIIDYTKITNFKNTSLYITEIFNILECSTTIAQEAINTIWNPFIFNK